MTQYKIIEVRLLSAVSPFAMKLSTEARQSVEHYIEVAEIEMACESFILSVLDERIELPSDTKRELQELCLGLRLDKESVFRVDFWQVAYPFLSESKFCR